MFILAIGFLALAAVLSLFGSICSTKSLEFFNEITLSEDTKVLKVAQLINDTGFTSLSCLSLNLTLINSEGGAELRLNIYKKNTSVSLRVGAGEEVVLNLQPPYSAYTFILEGGKRSVLSVKADCFSVTYPYKYFSVVSLVLFIIGTSLLLNSLFHELPKALQEHGENA
jgi:hypothetical protein